MNLLKAASTVSVFTLASRVTGLIRDQIMAATFGASALTDAFNVAFRIPNLLRRLFAEGAFSQAFVPILAATRAAEGDEATHRLVDAVATVLFWALLLTVSIGVVGAPVIVWAMASGLAAFDQGVVMTRLMFPYIACMSLVALAAGVLNTWRRFAVPAATPVLLNLCWIAGALGIAPWLARMGVEPIYGLAVGVMVGGVMQLAVQWAALRRLGMTPRIRLSISALRSAQAHPGVGRVLRNMAPALLGVSVAQLSLLINTQIASHVAVGAVSWLTYADRLMEFPTALLGVALGVVLTPQLAATQAREEAEAYSGLLDWGLRLVVLLAAPCAVALLVFPQALVAVLFHYGRFGASDVAQTVWAVMGWGVGLLGIVAVKVLAPGYFARQDVRTPVRIAVVMLLVTQLLNLVLVPWLGFAALSLSIGLSALLNAGLLLRGLLRQGVYRPAAGWLRFGTQVGVACVVMGAFLAWAQGAWDWIGLQQHLWQRAGWLALVLVAACGLYFLTLRLTGLPLHPFVRRGH
ncbi:MAG: murein biosynthesis integral membrane protein MurJ [Betaproteobacteria bacterium]|nr:murein biosynthesis integral membrane protein MurJ [Betaproteobacteria bacterium]